jgi:hypothetical protein
MTTCPPGEGKEDRKSDARAQRQHSTVPVEPSTTMLTYRLAGTTEDSVSTGTDRLSVRLVEWNGHGVTGDLTAGDLDDLPGRADPPGLGDALAASALTLSSVRTSSKVNVARRVSARWPRSRGQVRRWSPDVNALLPALQVTCLGCLDDAAPARRRELRLPRRPAPTPVRRRPKPKATALSSAAGALPGIPRG